MVDDGGRLQGMKQKIRESNVLSVLHRERLILAGFMANASAVAMVFIHQG